MRILLRLESFGKTNRREIFEIYERVTLAILDPNLSRVLQGINNIFRVNLVAAHSSLFKTQLINNLNRHNIVKGIHYTNLIIVDNKPYDLKLSLDYDIYIDDSPNLAVSIKNRNGKKLMLYDQP